MDRAAALTMAMAAMADRKAVAAEMAARLGLTTTTLYAYVNGDGTPKAAAQAVLDGTHPARPWPPPRSRRRLMPEGLPCRPRRLRPSTAALRHYRRGTPSARR